VVLSAEIVDIPQRKIKFKVSISTAAGLYFHETSWIQIDEHSFYSEFSLLHLSPSILPERANYSILFSSCFFAFLYRKYNYGDGTQPKTAGKNTFFQEQLGSCQASSSIISIFKKFLVTAFSTALVNFV